MSFNNTKRYDSAKRKRILIGETIEEETARLAKEIALARGPERCGGNNSSNGLVNAT
jgi:hypothetical protein